jgi:release factor glutamine methyltransferase
MISGGSRTLADVLRFATDTLEKTDIDGYDVEARLLTEWAFGVSRIDFVSQPNILISNDKFELLEMILARRIQGEPVHRIMGYRDFYGLRLHLGPETLEPRPDTEVLIDLALEMLENSPPKTILDLGTGTGALALALLSVFPQATVIATDIASGALEVAKKNAETCGYLGRFSVLKSDWFENVTGKFDLIVSNPPYIRTSLIPDLDIEVKNHDPLLALDGGPDGLQPYRIIAENTKAHLNECGFVLVEIGYDQAVDVTNIFKLHGFLPAALKQDLGGRDRILAFSLV